MGTAWYRDRAEEEARLRSAIETAVAAQAPPPAEGLSGRAAHRKPDLLRLVPVS